MKMSLLTALGDRPLANSVVRTDSLNNLLQYPLAMVLFPNHSSTGIGESVWYEEEWGEKADYSKPQPGKETLGDYLCPELGFISRIKCNREPRAFRVIFPVNWSLWRVCISISSLPLQFQSGLSTWDLRWDTLGEGGPRPHLHGVLLLQTHCLSNCLPTHSQNVWVSGQIQQKPL